MARPTWRWSVAVAAALVLVAGACGGGDDGGAGEPPAGGATATPRAESLVPFLQDIG